MVTEVINGGVTSSDSSFWKSLVNIENGDCFGFLVVVLAKRRDFLGADMTAVVANKGRIELYPSLSGLLSLSLLLLLLLKYRFFRPPLLPIENEFVTIIPLYSDETTSMKGSNE